MLVDSSTLLRTLQVRHPQHEIATRALEILPARGRDLHMVPQNLYEIWVVSTRSSEQNGLGLSVTAAMAELTRLRIMFPLLPDTPAIYSVWERLVSQYQVTGKPAHDARLVAAAQVHGLTGILTFDKTGFSRYPGLEVVHPNDVAKQAVL